MEHEDDTLGGRHTLQNDQQRQSHALVHGDDLRRVVGPIVRLDQGLREPGPNVSLVSDPRRSQLVETHPAQHDHEPGAHIFNWVEVGAQQLGERLLHRVLGFAVTAQQSVRDVEQEAAIVRPGLVEPLLSVDLHQD